VVDWPWVYLMKLSTIILLILFSAIVLNCATAETYTQKTGPFTINITSDESVDFTINPPLPVDNCKPYDISVDVGNNAIYRLEIQDYGKQININENDLMSAILSFNTVPSEYYTSWKLLKVGGKPGVMGTIGQGGESGYTIPGFVAAYSPDGVGIHGTTIVIISFKANQNNFDQVKAKFDAFVKDIRILKTG
jgi:hypothetical protein